MKQIVLDSQPNDQANTSEELGLMLNELAHDDELEKTLVSALVVIIVAAGVLLVGIGLYLNIFWRI